MTEDARAPRVDGMAGYFPCGNVEPAQLPAACRRSAAGAATTCGAGPTPPTGRSTRSSAATNGTAFVDVSEPTAPVYLGNLPTQAPTPRLWRDIKVYADHAYIVAEARSHGMQVFDLTRLRLDRSAAPLTFTGTHYYDRLRPRAQPRHQRGHRLRLRGGQPDTCCAGGLHMVDIREPAPRSPAASATTATPRHAVRGLPRARTPATAGREICFNSNADTLTIVDVTNKAPRQLSRTGLPRRGYTHQGWLTDDHAHFLMDDELDEKRLT